MTMTSSHSQTRCLTSRAYRYLSPALRQLRSRPARRPVLPRLSAERRQWHLHAVRGWRPSRTARRLSLPRFPSAGLKRIDSSMHRLLAKRTSQRIQPIRPNAAHPDLRGHPKPLQQTRRNCGEAWTSHLGATLLRHPPLPRSLPPRGRPVPVPRRRRGRGPWRAPRLLRGVSWTRAWGAYSAAIGGRL